MSFRQGARQFFEKRGAPAWTNPYITDGLVAMWDGEWNAGGGVHDANATTWVDLTGNGHDAAFSMGHSGGGVNPNGYFSSDAYVFPSGGVSTASFSASLGNVLTLQFCYSDMVRDSSYWALYDTYDDAVNFYWDKNNSGWTQCLYGARKILFVSGQDFLPLTGTVSHYFNGTIGGLQVNGNAANEASASSGTPVTKTWCIGGPYASNYFTGKMHSVRIYNRVLTASEIAVNYAIDKVRFNLP